MKEALLEIGSEELPASFIALGMRQLKALAEESLKASELPFVSVDVFGTPRRLAVVIHGLADRSPDQKKVISGPPVDRAKDAQGQWTPAAIGFARKQGLKPSDLTIENEKLTAVLHIKGVATRQLLSDLFPQWISKLEFPKSMTWEPTHFRYPRPIRWVAALYGSDLVSFTIAGVRSVRWTLGLGPWAPKKIPLTQAGKYALLLKNQCVLVDPAARQDTIRRFADQAVKRVHGKIHMSPALLDQVANLVEHPVAIVGGFDAAYLDLPKEVLITCLEHHQKYFPVEQASGGKLLPHFVGIRNGMSVHQDVVREGYERVLAARLADARFFFNQDRRTPLLAKAEALKGVMFQEKLGTLFEKKERLKTILSHIAGPDAEAGYVAQIHRAADLCKADLVTDVVREFPELQGVMARLYAEKDGEEERLSQALEQHYWPVTLSGKLPESGLASALALADKMDTLAGDFAVGLIPTGSADPYGLRRAAVGVLRILEHGRWTLSVERLIDVAVDSQPESVQATAAETKIKLGQFMQQRFAALLNERGFMPDEIDAVLASGIEVVHETLEKLNALKSLRNDKEFVVFATVFKRSSNIVHQALKSGIQFNDTGEGTVDGALFEQDIERELYRVLKQASLEVNEKIAGKEYMAALKAVLPIAAPLDHFFKEVMVMAEKPEIKQNRLAMMYWMKTTLTKVADFSKLQNA